MAPLDYDTAFEVRPLVGRALLAAAAAGAAFFLPVGGIALYAYFYWPTHQIIRDPPGETLRNATLALLAIVGVMLFDFVPGRYRYWVVNEVGVTVWRKGTPEQVIPWENISGVEMLPMRVFIATRAGNGQPAHPPRLSLTWIDAAAAGKLQAMWRSRDLRSGVVGGKGDKSKRS